MEINPKAKITMGIKELAMKLAIATAGSKSPEILIEIKVYSIPGGITLALNMGRSGSWYWKKAMKIKKKGK